MTQQFDRDSNAFRGLARLGDLDDWKVADGDPDIRGWDVKTQDGRKLGTVEELIVDPAATTVRYMEVKVDGREAGTKDDRYLLVPIGTARLDDEHDDVRIDRLPAGGFAGAPTYDRSRFDADYERSLQHSYGGSTGGSGRDLYDDRGFWGSRRRGRENSAYLTRSEEELAVGKRKVKAGEVDVHKRVETEHVREKVPVTREEVTVERRPLSGDAARAAGSRAEIRDDEIRVPVMAEEVVVDKRAVPKEELVIRKEAVRDEKTIEADLKKERIEVDRQNAERPDRR